MAEQPTSASVPAEEETPVVDAEEVKTEGVADIVAPPEAAAIDKANEGGEKEDDVKPAGAKAVEEVTLAATVAKKEVAEVGE